VFAGTLGCVSFALRAVVKLRIRGAIAQFRRDG
jgi:hypothetical protein